MPHLITERCVGCSICEIVCIKEAIVVPNAPTNLTEGTFALVGHQDFATVPAHRYTSLSG